MKTVAAKIAAETKTLGVKFLNYSNIDRENILPFRETLLDLLSHISPNVKKSVPASMTGSIITRILTTKPIILQVVLGFVAHHKPIIEHLHKYRVTTTYHEVRRFKIFLAVCKKESSGLTCFDAKNGLILVKSDNFHAHIHIQIGLKQTNGMETNVTQSYSTLIKSSSAVALAASSDRLGPRGFVQLSALIKSS